MAIVSSGAVSFSDINTEQSKNAQQTASLSKLCASAGFHYAGNISTVGSDFHGYTYTPSSVITDFGAEIPGSNSNEAVVTHTGHNSSEIIEINFDYSWEHTNVTSVLEFTIDVSNGSGWQPEWSQSVDTTTTSNSGSGSFSITNINSSDIPMVRVGLDGLAGYAAIDVTITGGSITLGSGSVTPSGSLILSYVI